MTINQLLQKLDPNLPLLEGTFGIERESLRIQKNTSKLATSPHPKALGARSYHPYIQTDFSESQLELITPVTRSPKEALRWLGAITDVAERTLTGEYLWPLSMPPKVTDEEIAIAQLEDSFERHYRDYLASTYGKTLQTMSGIHVNMALSATVIQALFEASDYEDKTKFQNDLYLKIAQNFLRYRWLLTYLYGASPIAERGFLKEDLAHPVRSIRSSQLGYVNHEDIVISYASLDDYITSLDTAVATKQLIAEKEHYSAVRLRGQKACRGYLEQPISYLELRCFDLNPFTPLGITQETMDSVHLFFLALLWLDDVENVDTAIARANALNNTIALSHPLEALPSAAPTSDILDAMESVLKHFHLPDHYKGLLEAIKEQVADPSLTLSGQLLAHITDQSLEAFGQKEGQAHHDYAWHAFYALKDFENMELSTQMLMFDAIQKGVQIEILDEEDQFLRLSYKGHIELVKNGNMTSKDNYVVPLAMANKVVTKKLLQEHGFPTPAGREFSDKASAKAYYHHIKKKAIVVKPKSTNFGLGISIFKEGASLEAYQKALDIAFSEDSSVLVEDYVAGTEYRFFILDGKCLAVLLRVAANVVGDGKHTIRELIDLKNQNPLRGRDHRSPLEIIELGEIEQLMLTQQDYSLDSVLEAGVKVDLRRNSNISTGGDSIDVTESMDDSYKQLASQMASTLGAWVCGVDLIIPDMTKKASKEDPHCTCIELNFNPSMYMHTYCQEGPGQVITLKILEGLFPEIRQQ